MFILLIELANNLLKWQSKILYFYSLMYTT